MTNISYSENYFDYISSGLRETKFFDQGLEIESSFFFDKVKENFLKLKQEGKRVFFFGNGASSAFANHMALDFHKNGKVLARSLSDSALMTALANDYTFDDCFVEFLKLERPTNGDLVVTISSSGNSPNIVKLLEYCALNKVQTLTLSGLNIDNLSVKFGELAVFVPRRTYGMVECIHQIFLHLFLDEFMGVEEWNRLESQNMRSTEFRS